MLPGVSVGWWKCPTFFCAIIIYVYPWHWILGYKFQENIE
jgi:hypothetical protein